MFLLPDEMFVSEAYLRVLRRPADPRGYLAYLRTLQSRTSRMTRVQLIRDLQASTEAAERKNANITMPTEHVATDLWPQHRPVTKSGLRFTNKSDIRAIEQQLAINHIEGYIRPTEVAHMRYGATQLDDNSGESTQVPADLSGGAAFTIATRSYLPFVRTLMQTLRTVHPELHLFLLLVDEPQPRLAQESWSTICVKDLNLDGLDDMVFRYGVVELCTALKPHFFKWLFEHTNLTSLIYLDPDICFYAPMAAVLSALNGGANLVLTPHITAPLLGSGMPSDETILQSGTFNLGFLAVRRSIASLGFLTWWAQRLRTGAVIEPESNLFTDQRWCDLAPSLVPDVVILRDHALNVAYWNLSQRQVCRDASGRWLVDGHPLVFFHFSGFNPSSPLVLSKYQDRLKWDDGGVPRQLFSDYAEVLQINDWAGARVRPYIFDSINGIEISPTLRKLYRHLNPEPTGLMRDQALQLLIAQCNSVGDPDSPLSPLMHYLHKSRPDLQCTFDLTTPSGRFEYEGWFWSTGVVEHRLVSVHRRVRALEQEQRPNPGPHHGSTQG